MQQDLFTSPYPHSAGYKNFDTSKKAASEINTKVGYLQTVVLDALADFGDLTADQCAKLVNQSVLTIRPRFSELKTLGKIRDTGQRRKNDSGKTAVVWSVKDVKHGIENQQNLGA